MRRTTCAISALATAAVACSIGGPRTLEVGGLELPKLATVRTTEGGVRVFGCKTEGGRRYACADLEGTPVSCGEIPAVFAAIRQVHDRHDVPECP